MTILAIVLLVLGGWVVVTFNGLVKLRNQVQNAFRQIDVQLKRRHDLIPNLVESVRGEMKFEKETLERVIQARAAAVSAGQGGNMNDVLAKEGMLTQALGRLIALTENYPNLKANDSVHKLMEELTHTENQIGFSRQFYNDVVTRFNTDQQVFPTNMFSAMLGFSPATLWELPADSPERENVKVNLAI
ncbi:MAG: LemA family protein [Elusimicrobia bacterium]|jgi:LemA protein|nr:LemA family protein [Elusimicrobiota bacterium]